MPAQQTPAAPRWNRAGGDWDDGTVDTTIDDGTVDTFARQAPVDDGTVEDDAPLDDGTVDSLYAGY